MTARVLVVDDIAANTRLLEAKLTHEYFDVITASDGASALAMLRSAAPDIVLLDVMMPGMDGFEVCRRIKSDPATMHVPVVMVTALSEVSDRVRGLEAGADDFLTKPIDEIALFARMKSLARLKTVWDELRLREGTSEQLGVITVANGEGELGDAPASVLVIEDEPFSAERLSGIVVAAGYRCALENDGAAALARLRAEPFDLVVMSIDLQRSEALRLCSQIRSAEETRRIPILLVIQERDSKRLAKGLELGATDYIMRPVDRHELAARMRSQIRRLRYEDRLREIYKRSISMALTDPLTGLYNRRYFERHLAAQIVQADALGKPLALAMLDLDHFKAVNDTYGHGAGDEVLREVGTRLSAGLRATDLAARLGGEEFALVLSVSTTEEAVRVVGRIRAAIGGQPFAIGGETGEITVTASAGVAMARGEEPIESLIERADTALYEAKRAGRDRVCLAPDRPAKAKQRAGSAA
jgi:two-component system cell cycle response regulator